MSKYSQRTPVRHRGVAPEDRYLQIGNDTVRNWAHSPEALQVYLLLLSHQGDGSFSESINSVADRYGWTWRRANRAVLALQVARRAVIAGGVWYVAVGEPFTEAEWMRLAGSAETAQVVMSKQQNLVLPKQHKLVMSKQQNIEEQVEHHSENQPPTYVGDEPYVSSEGCAACGSTLSDDCAGNLCSIECAMAAIQAEAS